MTVAGGANILTSHDNYVGLSAGHFLSPTGGCKTFDDEADGYCRAEAVASVVIKRLDTAEADNDNILGVILAAATNYSADAISITHPHGLSQKSLYKQVLDQAGIEPFDVDYVEMHGTGTQAGDACEMESVTSIFAPASPRRPVESPLLLNAIKANIGHGEAASGITSLMKALLVLREGTLPPHIGLQGRLNRNFVNLADRNVSIPLKKTPLPTKAITGSKRHVLINNFGAAGGNTAMIIEEASARSKADPALRDDRPDHVVNITAKTAGSLRGNTQNMLEYLESNPKVSLSDLSYTTTARRIQHRHRLSLVCSTVPELKASLEAIIQTGGFRAPEKVSNIVFAFTGQGVFYTSLGKGLYKSYSSFRISIERLNKIATDHGFPSFLSIVDGTAEEVTSLRLVQIHLSILAVQISLVQWLSSLGVRPDIVVGHSFGEYGAL
jgi:acyl transferase domain-containing protein